MTMLPDEILIEIGKFLDIYDLYELRESAKRFSMVRYVIKLEYDINCPMDERIKIFSKFFDIEYINQRIDGLHQLLSIDVKVNSKNGDIDHISLYTPIDEVKLDKVTFLIIGDRYSDRLPYMPNLIYLKCSYTTVKYVNHLTSLEYLFASQYITDVSNLVNLKFLDCGSANINNVSTLSNLEYLIYSDRYCGVKRKLPIGLEKLDKLIFFNCNKLPIRELPYLPNLKYLDCGGTYISDISYLINLEYLECCNSWIRSVSNLKKLKMLNGVEIR